MKVIPDGVFAHHVKDRHARLHRIAIVGRHSRLDRVQLRAQRAAIYLVEPIVEVSLDQTRLPHRPLSDDADLQPGFSERHDRLHPSAGAINSRRRLSKATSRPVISPRGLRFYRQLATAQAASLTHGQHAEH